MKPTPFRKEWREFEELVEHLHRRLHPGAVIKKNDRILGKDSERLREIDVSIRYELGPSKFLIVVECKRHKRLLDVRADGSIHRQGT